MEYTFISSDKLKYLYDNELIPKLMAYCHVWENIDVDHIYVYACHQGEQIYGLCVGTVYKPNTINRCSQWDFGENRNRELWIDHLHTDPSSSCKGHDLLRVVEEKLSQHVNSVKRKNIYIAAILDAVGFYEHCGYQEIYTLDNEEEDSDYPDVFANEVATWMCKGLVNNTLDDEDVIQFDISNLFGDNIRRFSVRTLQPYLNFPIGLDFFWFIDPEDLKNFEKFKKKTGRKFFNYTLEKFTDTYYSKYQDFLKALETYKTDKSQDQVSQYFVNVTKLEIEEILEQYMYICS